MDLKEAIVRSTKRLQVEKDARRSPEMRVKGRGKSSAKAIAKYEAERASRMAEGKSEELERDSDSRKQLVARGHSLLARMLKANEALTREPCSEIGQNPTEFRKGRASSWELLATREACTLAAEMRQMRQMPGAKARLTVDPYGRVRSQMAVRKTAAYLAKAEALANAEAVAAAAATAAHDYLMPVGDESDVELPSSPDVSPPVSPVKKKTRRQSANRSAAH